MDKLPFEITPHIQRCLEDILFLDKEYLLGGREGGDGREIVCLVEKYQSDEDTPRQRLNGRGFWKYLAEQNAILRFLPGKQVVGVRFSDIRKEELSKRGGVIAVGKNIKIPNEINYITSGQNWQQSLLKLLKQNYSKYELFQVLDIKPIEKLLGKIKTRENENGEIQDKKTPSINLPENTKWEDITIRFMDDDNVEISVKGRTFCTTNFAEMGFENAKTGRPDYQWDILKLMALQKGEFSWKDKTSDSIKDRFKYKKRKQKLKDALKKHFQLSESPFYSYKKEGVYKIKINLIRPFSDQSEMTRTHEDDDEDGIGKETREVFDEMTPSVYEEPKEYDDDY